MPDTVACATAAAAAAGLLRTSGGDGMGAAHRERPFAGVVELVSHLPAQLEGDEEGEK